MNKSFNRIWTTGALALGIVCAAFGQGEKPYAAGQIIVKFRPGYVANARMAHTAINSRIAREYPTLGAQKIQLRAGMSVEQAVRYYRGLKGVEYAEPNYIKKGYFAPNDPRYGNQWALPKVGAATAWDLTLGSSGVKIAVVDSGVDYNHEDLRGKVILGRDYINDDADPMDDHSHGTHVAGIAAGNTNNGIGIAGLGFNCQIIAVKVLDENNSGFSDGVAAGIQNAADLGAHIINLSLGSAFDSQIEHDAVLYARNKGALIVAAAGNDGTPNRGYPGAYEECLCVAATNSNDQRADFSTYGNDWVDVAAPGEGILSTVPHNGYVEYDGTSMASPLVAGLAGLMKAYSPSSTAAEIRAAIENNTVNVGDFIAKGRVNAPAAINALIRPIEMDAFAKSAKVYAEGGFAQGGRLLGGSGDLRFVDNRSVSVETVYQRGNGTMASAQLAIDFTTPASQLISAQLHVTHSSRREATNSIFLYNFNSGRYEVLKSVPGSTTFTTSVVNLPKNMTPYVQDGEIRLVVRSYVSARTSRTMPTFNLTLDQVLVRAQVRPE
ncbi:MAG: S8 family peptidase [Fimbriimonas sp.]